MTKKLFSLLLAAALVALAGQAAYAGVKASRHDMADAGNTYTSLQAFAKYGTCSACHVPHGAGGERLFPSTKPASVGGFFAPLCGSCHDLSVLNNINTRYNTTVLNSSHGYAIAAVGGDETLDTSGLPYTTADADGAPFTHIECLSCHDVHNQNSERPFLQVSIDNLCEKCHSNRVNNTLTDVGYATRAAGYTTHPAGPNFTGDRSGGGSPIVWGTLLENNANWTGGSTWTGKSPWDSGMHLSAQSATGGVDCVSCHIVHWDEDRGAIASVIDYLGIEDDQSSNTDTALYNGFCEYCHKGTFTTGSPAARYWNPGTTQYSHPNDDAGAASTAVTTAMGWRPSVSSPRLGPTASNGSGLLCTGCHGIHNEGAAAELQPNSPLILNYTSTGATNPCQACHQALGINHHPIGGSYATSGNTVGNLTCNGGNINVGVPTCHGSGTGTGNGAHNRSTGMSPNTNFSVMCVACHTTNPSVYTTTTPYTASGSASHFIGDAGVAFPAGTTGAGPRTTNDGTGGIVSPAWTSGISSVYVNTDGMICESCHNLGAGNLRGGDGDTQMLLELSGSAREVGTGFANKKNLCTGCHGIPAGTHPLENADPAAWPISGGNPGTGAAAGLTLTPLGLNCESCHSAHDANTQSGSYILDTTTTFGTNTNINPNTAVEPVIDYTAFCGLCHTGFN